MNKLKKLKAGRKVTLLIPKKRESRKCFARVLRHYEHYILFDMGKYRECFSKYDLEFKIRWEAK